jgi:hypothetical protein
MGMKATAFPMFVLYPATLPNSHIRFLFDVLDFLGISSAKVTILFFLTLWFMPPYLILLHWWGPMFQGGREASMAGISAFTVSLLSVMICIDGTFAKLGTW